MYLFCEKIEYFIDNFFKEAEILTQCYLVCFKIMPSTAYRILQK
jgi:hypothetical protein